MTHNDKVILHLDRPRELWFGHKAEKLLQAAYGLRPMDIDPQSLTPEQREQVLYCMLQRDAAAHNETLTLERLSELLDDVRPIQQIVAINDALIAAFAPSAEELEEAAKRKAEEHPTMALL